MNHQNLKILFKIMNKISKTKVNQIHQNKSMRLNKNQILKNIQ